MIPAGIAASSHNEASEGLTLVSYGGGMSNAGETTQTASITIQSGDLIIVKASGKSWGTVNLPTGVSGATWTNRGAWGSSVNGRAVVLSGSGGSAGTHTLSFTITATESSTFGFTWEVWRNHSGTGAVTGINSGNSANSQISITTTADNSGISWALSDSEDPSNGTSPQTPLSVGDTTTKELDFPTDGTTAQLHVAHVGVGTAGAKTIGRSTNMAQGHAYAAIEILSA